MATSEGKAMTDDKATPIFGRTTNQGRDTDEDRARRKEALRRMHARNAEAINSFVSSESPTENRLDTLKSMLQKAELRLSAMEKLLFSMSLDLEQIKKATTNEGDALSYQYGDAD